jgi:hypothetical protein
VRFQSWTGNIGCSRTVGEGRHRASSLGCAPHGTAGSHRGQDKVFVMLAFNVRNAKR